MFVPAKQFCPKSSLIMFGKCLVYTPKESVPHMLFWTSVESGCKKLLFFTNCQCFLGNLDSFMPGSFSGSYGKQSGEHTDAAYSSVNSYSGTSPHYFVREILPFGCPDFEVTIWEGGDVKFLVNGLALPCGAWYLWTRNWNQQTRCIYRDSKCTGTIVFGSSGIKNDACLTWWSQSILIANAMKVVIRTWLHVWFRLTWHWGFICTSPRGEIGGRLMDPFPGYSSQNCCSVVSLYTVSLISLAKSLLQEGCPDHVFSEVLPDSNIMYHLDTRLQNNA